MEFLKKIFDDERIIVGLCGFKTKRARYNTNPIPNTTVFNPFKYESVFETNFSKNVLL